MMTKLLLNSEADSFGHAWREEVNVQGSNVD